MQNFFLQLLKINGLILIGISLVILFQIWFEPISSNDMFKKIMASYFIVIINFIVLSTTYKHFDNITKTNAEKSEE